MGSNQKNVVKNDEAFLARAARLQVLYNGKVLIYSLGKCNDKIAKRSLEYIKERRTVSDIIK